MSFCEKCLPILFSITNVVGHARGESYYYLVHYLSKRQLFFYDEVCIPVRCKKTTQSACLQKKIKLKTPGRDGLSRFVFFFFISFPARIVLPTRRRRPAPSHNGLRNRDRVEILWQRTLNRPFLLEQSRQPFSNRK